MNRKLKLFFNIIQNLKSFGFFGGRKVDRLITRSSFASHQDGRDGSISRIHMRNFDFSMYWRIFSCNWNISIEIKKKILIIPSTCPHHGFIASLTEKLSLQESTKLSEKRRLKKKIIVLSTKLKQTLDKNRAYITIYFVIREFPPFVSAFSKSQCKQSNVS